MRINPCCGSNTSITFQSWDALQYYSKLPMWNTPRWPVIFPMLFRGHLWMTREGGIPNTTCSNNVPGSLLLPGSGKRGVWVSSLVLVTRQWQDKTINNPVYSKDISLVGLLKFWFFLNSSIGPYCQVLSAPHNGPFHPLVINPIPVDPPFLHPKTSA